MPKAFDIISIRPVVEGVYETQFMAMREGQCVGRVGVKTKGLRIAQMRQLFVAPGHRLNGIGKALVAACITAASSDGCIALNLTVAKCNEQVKSFYRPMGFIEAVEFEDGEAVMVLPLEP